MKMTSNNNLTPLAWYRSIREQHQRKSYAYGQVYPLYAPTDILLPFQIMREHREGADTLTVRVYTKDGVLVSDISQQMAGAGLSVIPYVEYGYDVIMFPGNYPMDTRLEEGMYYMTLSDGTDTWWSEILTLVNDVTPYLMIEWGDLSDLIFDAGIISYRRGYRNRVYLSTDLGKPDYTFEDEGESRDGYYFPEKQVSSKTYKCVALAPEFLIDAMRLVRLSDVVTVRDKFSRVYDCDTFLVTAEWQTQGDLASLEIEFTTSTVVKKTGRSWSQSGAGDYNDDYNNDYNNIES